MPSMIHLPHYLQERDYSCVAACARMVLGLYGIERTETELRQLLKTRPGIGTHPIHLRNLESLGVDATWPYPGTLDELRQIIERGIPVIAFVWTGALQSIVDSEGADYLHTIVIVGFSESGILIHDPRLDTGPVEISVSVFGNAWKYADHLIAVVTRPTF